MELAILHWIEDTISHPAVIQMFRVITSLGDGGFIWILSALMLAAKKRRKEALFLVLTLVLTSVCVDGVLKHLVMRERPFVTDPSLAVRIALPTSFSFPSGHSATSMCCAFFLFKTENSLFGKGALVLGILICLSRLVLLVHYPTDVICGAFTGVLCAVMMLRVMKSVQFER